MSFAPLVGSMAVAIVRARSCAEMPVDTPSRASIDCVNAVRSRAAFVRTMNQKAKALGMTRTHFDEPSGLSSLNVSSPRDLSKLLNAVSRDTRIREFSTLESHEVRIGKGSLVYRNTNLLVGKPDWDILVQKTGYTSDAGECLVMQAMIGERAVNMVLMNSFGKLTRTADARRVRRWMEGGDKPTVAGVREVAAK